MTHKDTPGLGQHSDSVRGQVYLVEREKWYDSGVAPAHRYSVVLSSYHTTKRPSTWNGLNVEKVSQRTILPRFSVSEQKTETASTLALRNEPVIFGPRTPSQSPDVRWGHMRPKFGYPAVQAHPLQGASGLASLPF